MLRISVIALSINNLTDARYFAALGVDWLGFNINPASESYINAEQLKEIIDWVEGPSMMVQGAQWNQDAQSLMDDETLNLSGQLLKDGEAVLEKKDLTVFANNNPVAQCQIFQSLEDWHTSGIPANRSFINYSGNIEDLERQLAYEEAPGLVLHGGNEEAAGIKSFEDLDDVFDLLYP